jgi:hypothetical protein
MSDPRIPENGQTLNLLGVDYTHVKTTGDDDLYLTEHGLPFVEQIRPESWFERSWFEVNRERLSGTSTVYRVRTKPVGGVGKDLVVKWCRVGEEVPFDTFTFSKFAEAEFNTPYEEFSLVMEMRGDLSPPLIRTHKPLAIYVPAKRLKLWQTGRSQSKIEQKKAKFRDVELDICRQYILIYEWVKGVSCVEAFRPLHPDERAWREAMTQLTERGVRELAQKGYRVLDTKPEHFIVRPGPEGHLLRDQRGEIAYALVDFELLERTPEHEKEVTASRRAAYLKHQKDRFAGTPKTPFPAHLKPASVLGVDYVYGHSESTQGWLWVVGRDPALFDYFLPERWRRTQRRRLSKTNEVYHTKTKDNINLVWKVSRVGEPPDADPASEKGRRITGHGYNSPFEEFELALELNRLGFPAVYPRAIYMTGQESAAAVDTMDKSRYASHSGVLTPDGQPALRPNHNYITVWGYWNGSDELLARKDVDYCRGINLLQGLEDSRITREEFDKLMEKARLDLARLGFEDLNPEGTHFLLSVTPQNELVRNDDSSLAVRICNFGLLRKIPSPAS